MKANVNLSLVLICWIGVSFFWGSADLLGNQPNEGVHMVERLKNSGFREVINTLKKSTETKDFSNLRAYILTGEPLYWAPCNSDSSDDLSSGGMLRVLLDNSKGASLRVNEESLGGQVEVEGWTGDYPYLYFDFWASGSDWRWTGVCYSAVRAVNFRAAQGPGDGPYDDRRPKESSPQLPRPGPRTSPDRLILEEALGEIIHFMAFDALKAYALGQKMMLGECMPGMTNGEIKANKVPVNRVIDFLSEQGRGIKGIKIESRHGYLETAGWCCNYPFIYFGFSKAKNNWEWAGIVYCGARLAP